MDINETLRLIRATITQMQLEDGPVSADTRPEFVQHARDLAEYFEAIDEWLSKGGFLPGDWRQKITHGEFTVELAHGDNPVPEFVRLDHPLVGPFTVYRYESVDDETYLVIDVDHETARPPIRFYVNDGLVFSGESADARSQED